MKVVHAQVEHAQLLLRYHQENRLRFKRWEPAREPEYFTLPFWEKRLLEHEKARLSGSAVHFIGVDAAETRVIGACSLTNIVYAPAWSCQMGYSVDAHYEGQGAMTAIASHAIGHAFEQLGLNRIAAGYMPENQRSGRLLEKLGFEREGLSRRLLRIDGQWADHVIMALLNPRSA